MRYQNWDVLLFPQEGNDTKTPLQEFKTCCDIVQDPGSEAFSGATNPAYYNAVTRALPTVSCYVPSLSCGQAFRVSLHCWSPPVLTKVTAPIESRTDVAVFEAKVLLDGACVAGLVFRSDAHWPQVIDNAAHRKDSKPSPLRFPPFRPEMLSQAWVLPGQSMGRIKVIIAEGVSHGSAGTVPFERTRNLVAFSFQHTPLSILEESGIAWPNPGMFYQILQQNVNPLSPHKNRDPDPDSHAHSPHHGVSRRGTKEATKADAMLPPPTYPYGLMQPGIMIPPPPFRIPGPHSGDPFHYSCCQHDPFSGAGDLVSQHHFFQDYTRHTSSSGDISMQDIQPKSRSTISDQAMLDVRSRSPVSSYKSYEMNDSRRPLLSPEIHEGFALIPSDRQPESLGESRQVSGEFARVPKMQRSFTETGALDDSETLLSEPSQFAEMVDAMSPRNVHESGCHPPTNTRVSSAASTPPIASRSSALAEARALSYSNKQRAVSTTTRDVPPATHSRTMSEIVPKARSKSQKTDLRRSVNGDENASHAQNVVKKAPSTSVKSRKENRTSEIGHENNAKPERRASSGPTLIQDKENIDALHPSCGDSKRRRVSGGNASPGAPLGSSSKHPYTPIKISSQTDTQVQVLDKINNVDVLTAEGVAVRTPLGDMGNMT